jgi:hypothetical protein
VLINPPVRLFGERKLRAIYAWRRPGQTNRGSIIRRVTESGDRRAKVAQYGRLGITYLAHGRDLGLHVDTAEPRTEHGDGNSWHGKYRSEVNHSEEL